MTHFVFLREVSIVQCMTTTPRFVYHDSHIFTLRDGTVDATLVNFQGN